MNKKHIIEVLDKYIAFGMGYAEINQYQYEKFANQILSLQGTCGECERLASKDANYPQYCPVINCCPLEDCEPEFKGCSYFEPNQ